METLFLPMLLLLLALPLFLSVRRQKKQMQEQQELQNSLEVGDRVMTSTGLYATVVDLSDDETLELEIADGLVTTWLRQAVTKKIEPVDEDEFDDDMGDSEDSEDSDDADLDESSGTDSAEVASSAESGGKQ
ncbi:preprotein translocase subunit YajC [Haloechinothrix sp. YIM 98757]|uniref:Preprotein translocase subunit YajC n=1 Tax=Haloechinothrix aidingensis TaxID=2752311 RepID=A0A838A900_9PSEU|nr:preprotein translocase subunit YajC [Haloechinothrix aidingensis]MBA0126025.1 preprotein translocase subunit YajC [Haloechinothrix aidingensis]